MPITAPYNFVPLSNIVVLPEWADDVSHDLPFADGYCGVIDLQIQSHTPMLPGQKNAEDDNSPVEHFKLPDGHLAIPGSTLRGMIRNVVEIASFGKMRLVDDKRYGIRDLTAGARAIYGDRFTDNLHNRYGNLPRKGPFESKVKSGWLFFDKGDNRWKITPCEHARVDKRDLIQYSSNDWNKLLRGEIDADGRNVNQQNRKLPDAEIKYRWWIHSAKPLKVSFTVWSKEVHPHSDDKFLIYSKGSYSAHSGSSGWLVFTGQPSPRKHMEFIFHSKRASSIEVDASVIRDFKGIYDPKEEKKRGHYHYLKTLDFGGNGMPVFYLENAHGNITSIGLSQMYKLPYKNSIGELIGKQNSDHRTEQGFDLVELIFGAVDESDGKRSLKGRVSFSHARSEHSAGSYHAEGPHATILNGPKPTYYPNYIVQDERNGRLQGGQYKTCMNDDARIRGWKRYPVRTSGQVEVQQLEPDQSVSVQTQLRPVTDPVIYSGKLRLHNLKKEELGALLWALTWNGHSNYRHAIGMGKPFGYGQIGIAVDWRKSDIFPNRPDDSVIPSQKDFMDAFRTMMEQQISNWENTDQLKQLLAMADPDKAGAHTLKHLKLNGGGRNNEFTRAKGAQRNPRLVLEKYTTAGEEATIRLTQEQEWLEQNIAQITGKDHSQPHQVRLGRQLAGIWNDIDDVQMKKKVLALIRAYWEEHGGWEAPHNGRSKKAAHAIYTGNNR